MDLAERLRQRRRRTRAAAPAAAPEDAADTASASPGSAAASPITAASPAGAVVPAARARELPTGWVCRGEWLWERRTVIPVSAAKLKNSPRSDREEISALSSVVVRRLAHSTMHLLMQVPLDRAVFIDTETTGLSGGAGTTVFLAGMGQLQGSDFVVTQWFAADFPGEAEMLQSFAAALEYSEAVVSYNGRSFDWPLLQSKSIMSGVQLPSRPQLDLLHPVRRLYRDILPDCRLGTLEQQVLGLPRGLDVPGSEVPRVYTDFLADGNPEILQPVFAHHLQDIQSLFELLQMLRGLAGRAGDAAARGGSGFAGVQHLGLAQLTAAGGGDPVPILENGVSQLCRQGNMRRAVQLAGVLLGSLRQMKDWDSALTLLAELRAAAGPAHYWSAVETAKILEHRLRDYSGALQILEPLAPAPEIEHRRQRLRRRLGRE